MIIKSLQVLAASVALLSMTSTNSFAQHRTVREVNAIYDLRIFSFTNFLESTRFVDALAQDKTIEACESADIILGLSRGISASSLQPLTPAGDAAKTATFLSLAGAVSNVIEKASRGLTHNNCPQLQEPGRGNVSTDFELRAYTLASFNRLAELASQSADDGNIRNCAYGDMVVGTSHAFLADVLENPNQGQHGGDNEARAVAFETLVGNFNASVATAKLVLVTNSCAIARKPNNKCCIKGNGAGVQAVCPNLKKKDCQRETNSNVSLVCVAGTDMCPPGTPRVED